MSCMDCQSPTPTPQNLPYLVNRSADWELWISILQAIDELVCFKNPKLLFYFLVLRSWGWNLAIVAGQPKMPTVATCICSLWLISSTIQTPTSTGSRIVAKEKKNLSDQRVSKANRIYLCLQPHHLHAFNSTQVCAARLQRKFGFNCQKKKKQARKTDWLQIHSLG